MPCSGLPVGDLLDQGQRGDAIEVQTLQMMAQLYSETGRYSDSLAAARTATRLMPNSEVARRAQDAAAADGRGDVTLVAGPVGVVLVGGQDGVLYALSPIDGRRLWSFNSKGPFYAAPLVTAGTVYAPGGDGTPYAWSGTLVVNREQAECVRTVSAIDLVEGLLRPTVQRERARVG